MSEHEGPPLRRPIPRRPFRLSWTNSTPPEDSAPSSSNSDTDQDVLDPQAFNFLCNSISRSTSYDNLATSTLAGIYSPSISGYPANDPVDEFEPPGTQYSPGPKAARTDMREYLDEGTSNMAEDRSSRNKKHAYPGTTSSSRSAFALSSNSPAPPKTTTLSLGIRTTFLFALGMAYGALLSRLSTEKNWAPFPVEAIIKPGSGYAYDSEYLTCCGLFGVLLGCLMPWFDEKWDETFGNPHEEQMDPPKELDPGTGTDWALVVRGAGAFAGIVFAIRKVPWASTMQVSMTLAMVNPVLWYLIDRSKSGFYISSAVGLAGSLLLMALNSEIMPTPTRFSSDILSRSVTLQNHAEQLVLGGLATQKTMETGIWVLSVLFCSCVCFGNIGRRLALNASAASRGRWGGLR